MGVLKDQRRELFAQNRAGGMGKGKSAKAAGFSGRSAHTQATRMLKEDEVVARIQELQQRAATQVVLTKSWVIEKLIAVHDSAMIGNPVLDRYGKATGAIIKNHSAANRALELLGKTDGLQMFTDKTEIDDKRSPVREMMDDIAGRSRLLPSNPPAEQPESDSGEPTGDTPASAEFAKPGLIAGATETKH